MSNLYFHRVYVYGGNSDAGVSGVEKPLLSTVDTLTGSSRVQFYVSALNFRSNMEVTETDYLGASGTEKGSTREVFLECDLIVSLPKGDYKYPEVQTNIETWLSVSWQKYKYHWLSFDESAGLKYSLKPDMITATGATKQVWACNLVNFTPTPDANYGGQIIVGKLSAIKAS